MSLLLPIGHDTAHKVSLKTHKHVLTSPPPLNIVTTLLNIASDAISKGGVVKHNEHIGNKLHDTMSEGFMVSMGGSCNNREYSYFPCSTTIYNKSSWNTLGLRLLPRGCLREQSTTSSPTGHSPTNHALNLHGCAKNRLQHTTNEDRRTST